jgi:SAM-dependent methyltransferase
LSDPGRDLELNVAAWTKYNAEYADREAIRRWQAEEIDWGVWSVPEREVGVIGDVAGLDVVELGCGTAYFSAWLARRGARPVGVDPTPVQLETARRCQRELGIEFPLVEAPAQSVPLPDASFDLALSEYGASIWADPAEWLPEAARLLRPSGRLVFLVNSPLAILSSPDGGPAGERLVRPQRGMYRVEWVPDEVVNFHPPHGEWIRLLGENGFVVERLLELYAPADAHDHEYYGDVPAEWAKKWPPEDVWVARKA